MSLVPSEHIAERIAFIRGQKVLLDADLAALYGVETKYLKRQVVRNRNRFPEDFMFELTTQELVDLRRQFGTSSLHGGTRYLPYAFTEQGIAMLSGILNSERAVDVNIAIMRAFVKLRSMMQSQENIKRELSELKQQFRKQFKKHDEKINTIFLMMDEIIAPLSTPKKKRSIGFVRDLDVP